MKHVNIDREILQAAKKGDIKAFEYIMNSYFHPIYSYVYHMVDNKEETSDLVQESFLKVYIHLHNYNLEKKFSTWLFTIVQRTVYDWLRKKRRFKETFIINNPDRHLEAAGKRENLGQKMDINKALSHLPSQYKEVLFLYFWQGYNYKEISEILDKPVNTVKTLLKRAKEKLREEM